MNDSTIIVAGHICLDVMPEMGAAEGLGALLKPGGLVEVGPALTTPRGAVSNTGIALHRLGLPVRLMGKVGDDAFGRALMDALRSRGAPTNGMIVVEGEATSYTIVLSPPGIDRFFLHFTGANSTFAADDVRRDNLTDAGYFHFGYPPLMRRMYLEDGRETAKLLERVTADGIFTSLDMATLDPASEAGRIDWRAWLRCVLPHVDLFEPSLDEILFMLGLPEETDYGSVAEDLLGMGARMVAFKLGARGLYLRTSSDLPDDWAGRELLAPCFEVEVAGTTGAGDCTLAGLLAGLWVGARPETAMTLATAAGACSVEQADSTSGIPSMEALLKRIGAGSTSSSTRFRSSSCSPDSGGHTVTGRSVRWRSSVSGDGSRSRYSSRSRRPLRC